MKCTFLAGFTAVLVATVGGLAQAETLPSQLWLRPGETYVDIDGVNTPVAASHWGYPDTSDSIVSVNGNLADDNRASKPTMDMTIAGLTADTAYSFDVVLCGKLETSQNLETYFGVAAGYQADALTGYNTVGTAGRQAAYAIMNGDNRTFFLYRMPLGTTIADSEGVVHVFMDDYLTRSEVDGVIYSQPTEPPPARLIGTVDRTGGASGSKNPIGAFTGDTDPLVASPGGVQLGNPAMTDRLYVFDTIDTGLAGAEFVRVFGNDATTADANYAVTFLQRSFAMVMVDDAAVNPQAWVDAVVDDFAPAGTFTDTGRNVSTNEIGKAGVRTFSAYGAWLDAGTYNFGSAPVGAGQIGEGVRAYGVIAAMVPEPATLALLLGMCFVVLGRRGR